MRNMTKAKRLIAKAPRIRNHGGSPQLVTVGDIVYSYNTAVAVYIDGSLYVPIWYSTTTSRHINKIAEEWNCEVVKDF